MNETTPIAPSQALALGTMAEVLDSLAIGMCVFDAADRTLLWNKTFLDFFPEHAGHVHVGESYADNLRRFYARRLTAAERVHLEMHVADGIARHRAQSRPFMFSHGGRRLRVASLPLPGAAGGGRVRVWISLREQERPVGPPVQAANPMLGADLFENLADGAMVLDAAGRIVAVNQEFLTLYDADDATAVMGLTFPEVIRQAWLGTTDAVLADQRIAAFVDNARFAGAAFEVEMPGERWRRVIERRMTDGTAYLSHADITLLKQQQRALMEAYRRLQTLAVTDPLTGLANRRGFEEAMLLHDTAHQSGHGPALALLLIDIDRFKQVNDLFGHQSGDLCLQQVASIIQGLTRRDHDLVARFGGEEFAVVMPGTDAAAAMQAAERIRQTIEAERSQDHNRATPVTVSVGVAVATNGLGAGMNLLIQAADQALYRAKREGRNRVALG